MFELSVAVAICFNYVEDCLLTNISTPTRRISALVSMPFEFAEFVRVVCIENGTDEHNRR